MSTIEELAARVRYKYAAIDQLHWELLDALEAEHLASVTNAREADEAVHAAARHKSDAALLEFERDRYRDAIEAALSFESILPAIATVPRDILTRALKETE